MKNRLRQNRTAFLAVGRCRRSSLPFGIFEAVVVLCILIPLARAGQAQGVYTIEHKKWEVTAFAGGSFSSSGTYGTPIEGSSQSSSRTVGLKYDAGAQLGIRVTDNQWQHWAASFEYSYSDQPITFTNLSDSIPTLELGHAVHRFAYDVIYHFRDRSYRLRPFVFGGPGVSLFYVKESGKNAAAAHDLHLSDPWKFAVNWGGGTKYLIRRHVAASVQLSDSISGVPGYGLPESGRIASGVYVPGFRPNGHLNNWLLEGGIVFQWDWD